MPNPNNGFTRSTPAVADGKVYTVSTMGKVHCLDAQSGKVIWLVDMPKDLGGKAPQWGYAASPLLDGDRLIVAPGAADASVAALDAKSGAILWKSGTDKAGYATPVIATINGVRQYVVFSGTGLNGYATDGGKLLWTFPWKTSYDVNAAAPLVMGNSVFISSGYGTGCAMMDVAESGATVRWKNKAMQQHFSSAVVFENMIYGTTDPGDLVCLDPQTGKETWRHRGFEKGGIVALDGVVIGLSGNTGDLIMVKLDPKQYEELGRTKPLGGQSWTAPVVADGKILVRNNQNMACFELK